jgi:DNA-directed RNA polymerase specialized sigma24 family protein
METAMTDAEIASIHARIVSAGLAAGLPASDAEDLAQDIWTWFIASNKVRMATLPPWVSAVIVNFVRRYRRRVYKQQRISLPLLEGSAVVSTYSSASAPSVDARLFLACLSARTRLKDRLLLEQLLTGRTLTEASRMVGISRGSEQFHLNRIRQIARTLSAGKTARSATRGNMQRDLAKRNRFPEQLPRHSPSLSTPRASGDSG